MSENPTDQGRAADDRTGEEPQLPDEKNTRSEPGKAADIETIPGEKPKDAPEEEGEDRFDAG